MKLRSRVRWCVRHRAGWCAIADNRKPAEGSDWVPTLCGIDDDIGVTLGGGYDRREPDCPDCLALLPEPAATEEDTHDGSA